MTAWKMAGDEGHEGNEGRTPCVLRSKRVLAHPSMLLSWQDFLVDMEGALQFLIYAMASIHFGLQSSPLSLT